MNQTEEEIFNWAKKSLQKNIIYTPNGKILVAGAHQFRTLWVRDFCFSVPALLLINEIQCVKDTLDLIIHFQQSDGLIPRGIDCLNPKLRVILNTLCKIPDKYISVIENGQWHAEYKGEHGTIAFDSNILFLLALKKYEEHTNDKSISQQHSMQIKKALQFYDKFIIDSLFHQPPYSDWQDSVQRKGAGFYFHLLYLLFNKDKNYIKKVFDTFFNHKHKLFSQSPQGSIFSLESQLWCINSDLFHSYISQNELFSALKTSSLWENKGIPVFPSYPLNEISFTTKLVGLKHYHTQLRWSWLLGELLKTCRLMNDLVSSDELINTLHSLLKSHPYVCEIYHLNNASPFHTLLYQSESPFSWGAAKIIESLSASSSN